MAVHYRTQGFFIRKADRGEANQLFTVYTKDFGKIEILGKAIRKIKSKLRSGANLFYLSEIEFIQGKTHKTLTDAILIKNYSNIRKDLEKLGVAHQINQALNDLVKGQEADKEIWNLLTDVFNRLDRLDRQKPDFIYHYFLWNLFSILGYQPELFHCVRCQKRLKPGIIYFSFKEGGVVCEKCLKRTTDIQEINMDVVKILRLFLTRDWAILARLKVSSESQKLLDDVSGDYLSEILSKN